MHYVTQCFSFDALGWIKLHDEVTRDEGYTIRGVI